MTSYLAVVYPRTPFPTLWADHLAPLLSTVALNEIVDLGSGAAGPVPLVVAELSQRGFRLHATLTDLYPNVESLRKEEPMFTSLTYCPDPVDATRVPDLPGIRTMFTVFHHFRPQTAHLILKKAFEQRRTICIFEATSRTAGSIASALLIPLMVWIFTPLIRPISGVQILFTYFLPLIPLLSFWDGLVSHLRTYSAEELTRMTNDLRSPEYIWEAGEIQVPRLPAGLPYLIGRPADQ